MCGEEVSGKMKMKDLPVDERPYEKLEKYGEDRLSDAELLAIIIKTGTKEERVVELSQRILKSNITKEGLSSLYNTSIEELQTIKGIGRVKAIQIKAIGEISKRISKERNFLKYTIANTSNIVDIYMEEMRHKRQETCKIVLVDKYNKITYDKNITIGNINASIVDPREVFKSALEKGARGVFLMHNHPSGDPMPSKHDIDITVRLKEAGIILGINFIDHIIIGDGEYASMKEYGVI